ncbi:MAG: putative transcriptional regulator, PucR family [Frankiales bacterium]|nr:putative transcriptional regulator, PucR family [Frankiales bacterium]
MTGPLSLTLPPELASVLAEQMPALADEVLEAIAREVPLYARPLDGRFGQGVRLGVQEALGRFLRQAGEAPDAAGDETKAAQGREVYRELGRGEARVGRPLEALLSAYRTGARVAWSRLAALGLATGVPAAQLVDMAAAVFAYIDELSSVSAEGYALEQSQLAGDRERRQRALVRLLLAEVPASEVEEASVNAGRTPPLTLTPALVPGTSAREMAFRWDPRSLIAAEDDAAGRALLLLPDVDGPGQRDRLTRMLDGRTAVVGLPMPWLEVRASVALTRRAAAVGGGAGASFVEDHLAALVVSSDGVALAELRRRRLAPFADLTVKQRGRLLDTLRSWLAHQGDRQAVAADLAVHPQTVRYRVGLLRERLGADLDDPLRRFELSLVLYRPWRG